MRQWVAGMAVLIVFCAPVKAQTSVTCPAYVLAKTPDAICVARDKFTFLVFGSIKVLTPSQGCELVRLNLQNSANIEALCQYAPQRTTCQCFSNGNFVDEWGIREDPQSLEPACPADYDPLPERVVITGAEGYQVSVRICRPRGVCPVKPLLPSTDPAAQEHETGPYSKNPDMEHVSEAVKAGATCIKQRERNAEVTSGFRPQAYQDHLREVWDKWAILKNDNTEACKKIKDEVWRHDRKHRMKHQPGITSNHTTGTAVDFGGITAASADKTAKACNMHRPYANDPVHFQPLPR